jgi:hypothetical protein
VKAGGVEPRSPTVVRDAGFASGRDVEEIETLYAGTTSFRVFNYDFLAIWAHGEFTADAVNVGDVLRDAVGR